MDLNNTIPTSLPSIPDSFITERDTNLRFKIHQLLRRFAASTTSHGLPHIIASPSRILKIIWTIGLFISIIVQNETNRFVILLKRNPLWQSD